MNKTTEALKLAEEALEELHYSSGTVIAVTLYKSALAAIREALAEQRTYPNLEPVINWLEKGCDPKEAAKELRIYAESMKDHFAAIREVLAEPVKQEPVAWIFPEDLEVLLALKEKCGEITVYGYQRSKLATNPNDATVPLYAAPVDAKAIRAEREWVDLTDDEMWDVFISKDWTGEPLHLMSAVIAAFKEKNK